MLKLIDPNRGMPSGWKYIFPETGFEVKASNFNALVRSAAKHAAGNNIDTETLVARIEDYICHNAPDNYCVEEGSPLLPKSSPIVVSSCGGCGGGKTK